MKRLYESHGWDCALLPLLAVTMLLVCALPASAQKNSKKNAPAADSTPPFQLPTAGQIDNNIGEMLGAWQVGDVEAMHKYYADDATFTSGAYEVPIVGWKNYLVAYQKQRSRIQALQLIRRNTSVYFRTDFAWASYQWELTGVVDNAPMSARGQTTLVFALTNGRWLIVHNHTSEICGADVAAQPANQPGATATPKSPN